VTVADVLTKDFGIIPRPLAFATLVESWRQLAEHLPWFWRGADIVCRKKKSLPGWNQPHGVVLVLWLATSSNRDNRVRYFLPLRFRLPCSENRTACRSHTDYFRHSGPSAACSNRMTLYYVLGRF
jgi:hypothetical protein